MNQNNSQVSTEIWVMQAKLRSIDLQAYTRFKAFNLVYARIGTVRTSYFFNYFQDKSILMGKLIKNQVMSLLIIAVHSPIIIATH